jgi:molybdopterin synthase sulfur carrier subunit
VSSVIRVVYLGKLADIAGKPESQFGASDGELDWPDLVEVLRNHVNADISEAIEDSRTRVAVNGVLLADKTDLVAKHGDEIALLPPVSGG